MDDVLYDSEGDNRDKPVEQKERMFHAYFAPGSIWLDVNIGWSDQEFDSQGLDRPETHDLRDLDLLEYVCETLAEADPEKVCKFKEVVPVIDFQKKMVELVSDTLPRNENERE